MGLGLIGLGKNEDIKMTEEQKLARKKSAENGNIKWIKEHCLRTKDGQDDFVFISYKSDDYKQVLDDIVYKVCKKYGLRVYFDTAFDEGSDSWIKQYYDNMSSVHCKAFIAFIDNAYYSSYATLLEMMSRGTAEAGGDYNPDSLFFLPINLESISEIIDESNTGLGTETFADGKINKNAGLELSKFNEIFYEIANFLFNNRKIDLRTIYKKEDCKILYKEATENTPAYGEMYLKVTQCRKIMEKVIPDSNDNDGTNKDFVEVIHDKLINAGLSSVFGKTETALEEVEVVDSITGSVPLGGQKVKLSSENQSRLVPNSVPGCMKKWRYYTKKGANASILWDGNSKNCKVLKGSMAAKESDKFATSAPAAKKLKDKLVSQGTFSGLTFVADYDCDKIATVINLLNGGSVSMPAEIKGRNLVPVEDDINSADNASLKAPNDMDLSASEPNEQSSDEHVYIYKNVRIKCDIDSKICTILKGSKIQGESPKFATNASGAKKLKDELQQKGIIVNDVFLEDYTGSIATLMNLINGGSVSAPKEKMKFKREN